MEWFEVFAVFLVSHLVGDYLLQTDWQAVHKHRGLGPDPVSRRALASHVATYTIAMEVATGVPKDGNNVFGVGRNGVGYSTSGGFVDPIKARLDAFAARIASGEILVPTTP